MSKRASKKRVNVDLGATNVDNRQAGTPVLPIARVGKIIKGEARLLPCLRFAREVDGD